MVLQQCVACNAKLPGAYRVCSCGHVLEDMKQIGGKRFSGYRAQLYDRLEARRMKALTKPIQRSRKLNPNNDENKDININQINNEVNAVLPKAKIAVNASNRYTKHKKSIRHRRHKRFHRGSTPSNSLDHKSEQISSELLSRFPSALSEINKRILQQNKLWTMLLREQTYVIDR